MLMDKFLLAAGSIIGSEHRRIGINNQDGYYIAANGYALAAAVSDGCSSSRHSEVGAKLLSRFVAEEALRLMKYECVLKGSEIIKCLEEKTIEYMKKILSEHQNPGSALDEMFLATIVGVVMNDYFTTIFTIGDGVYSLNGEAEIINEDNRPNYLAYKIFPEAYEVNQKNIKLNIRKEVFTDEVDSLIIATDGAGNIIEKADKKITVLGKEERVKGLNQFAEEGRYVKNPSLLQKRLVQLNADKTIIDWENRETKKVEGILSDDTTIILIKRAPAL